MTSVPMSSIVCITDYSDFRLRIRRPDVECYALHKPPGKVPGFYVKVWRLLRRLRPRIVHTRNLAALDKPNRPHTRRSSRRRFKPSFD